MTVYPGGTRRWLAILFPWSAHVAAGPLNPPTLGRRRVGAYRAGIACTVEKKLYGGRGLGLVRCRHVSILVFQMGGFTVGKCRVSLRGRFRVSDECPERLSEVSRRAFGRSREAQSGQNDTNMGPI